MFYRSRCIAAHSAFSLSTVPSKKYLLLLFYGMTILNCEGREINNEKRAAIVRVKMNMYPSIHPTRGFQGLSLSPPLSLSISLSFIKRELRSLTFKCHKWPTEGRPLNCDFFLFFLCLFHLSPADQSPSARAITTTTKNRLGISI